MSRRFDRSTYVKSTATIKATAWQPSRNIGWKSTTDSFGRQNRHQILSAVDVGRCVSAKNRRRAKWIRFDAVSCDDRLWSGRPCQLSCTSVWRPLSHSQSLACQTDSFLIDPNYSPSATPSVAWDYTTNKTGATRVLHVCLLSEGMLDTSINQSITYF